MIGTLGFTTITFGVALVPLVVQNTIFNTAPFWASLLSFCFLKEYITKFEICAMILSFGGVCMISVPNEATGEEIADEESEEVGTSSSKQILGSGLIFCTAWCYATVSILTRKMQKIHFAVMLFYYSVVAFTLTSLVICVDVWISDKAFGLFTYNSEQWLFTLLLSSVNFIGLNCQTIALQNERSGFITLLGYIGLFYAFLGDIFIFKETFAWLELAGISVVLIMNISLICSKQIATSNSSKP